MRNNKLSKITITREKYNMLDQCRQKLDLLHTVHNDLQNQNKILELNLHSEREENQELNKKLTEHRKQVIENGTLLYAEKQKTAELQTIIKNQAAALAKLSNL
jgi:hypothetical protein